MRRQCRSRASQTARPFLAASAHSFLEPLSSKTLISDSEAFQIAISHAALHPGSSNTFNLSSVVVHLQATLEGIKKISNKAQGFPFFVRLLSGGNQCFVVRPYDSVALLLPKITDQTGISKRCFRLLFQGRYLHPDARLGDYDLCKDVTVHLVSGLQGGDGGSTAPSSSKQRSFKEAVQTKDRGAASLRPKVLTGSTYIVEHS